MFPLLPLIQLTQLTQWTLWIPLLKTQMMMMTMRLPPMLLLPQLLAHLSLPPPPCLLSERSKIVLHRVENMFVHDTTLMQF